MKLGLIRVFMLFFYPNFFWQHLFFQKNPTDYRRFILYLVRKGDDTPRIAAFDDYDENFGPVKTKPPERFLSQGDNLPINGGDVLLPQLQQWLVSHEPFHVHDAQGHKWNTTSLVGRPY